MPSARWALAESIIFRSRARRPVESTVAVIESRKRSSSTRCSGLCAARRDGRRGNNAKKAAPARTGKLLRGDQGNTGIFSKGINNDISQTSSLLYGARPPSGPPGEGARSGWEGFVVGDAIGLDRPTPEGD